MKYLNIGLFAGLFSMLFVACHRDGYIVRQSEFTAYPEVTDVNPGLPSPFVDEAGRKHVVAVTKEDRYAVFDVTPGNDRGICQQLVVDTLDFPDLVRTGLHSEERLSGLETITDRSLAEITELGRPGGLSHGGFLAEDEDIRSVLLGDNQLVRDMGLTHPELATPLLHVLNMMDTDLSLERWNMARHEWENVQYFFYNDQKVFVRAYDTKGGQLSIFDDGIQGAFHIQLWRDLEESEVAYLESAYDGLTHAEMDTLKTLLSSINTGEMQPQYIMRYGFYEGHTFWRADPVAIAFIFGLKGIEEIDRAVEGRLFEAVVGHYIR